MSNAEDPRGIIWANATVAATEGRVRRSATAFVVYFFAAVGYIPLILSCNALSNLNALSELNGLGWLSHDDEDASDFDRFLFYLLETQLPVGLQVLILSLLPILFQNLSEHYERAKTIADVQARIMSRYFLFQLVQIFGTLLGDSLSKTILLILEKPSCVLELLGTAIPLTAVYFTQIILIKTLLGLPLELSRLWPLIRISWFKRFQRDRSSKAQKRKLRMETSEFVVSRV